MSLQLIEQYLSGPDLLENSIQGMSPEQLQATPVPGKWSAHFVICHIADFEIISADRIKRGIAEKKPILFGGDPDLFASRLYYEKRHLKNELALIRLTRQHVGTILEELSPADFEREIVHSEAGLMTITRLLERIINHIPHHIKFIQEKRQALGI